MHLVDGDEASLALDEELALVAPRRTADSPHGGEPMQQALDGQLTPDARAVSVALRDAGRLSTGDVATMLGRSRPYALRVLESLRTAGVIRWVGKSQKDPRAYWELDPR